MNIADLVESTVTNMKNAGVDEDSIRMRRYMKDQYDFFGVKSPARKNLQKELKIHWKKLDNPLLFSYAEALWQLPQRELQYMALDVLETRSKKWDKTYLNRIEQLILTKSWWDTVDALASNIAGAVFFKNPEIRMTWVERWNNSDNMWLNRSALIHQLRYKEDVNMELLFTLVESHINSREFFINKASGWALRQASKFYPNEVKKFISDHPNLANLAKREGSKYLS